MNGTRIFDFDALRRDNPLPQVVGSIVKLQKCGAEWKACCPLHEDRTPSFTIFDGGQRFHCFGCQAGGDVVDFVVAYRGVSTAEAARQLHGDTPLPKLEAGFPPRDRRDERDKSERSDEARDIWICAQPAPGTVAETYLKSRGIRIPLPPTLRFDHLNYGKCGPTHPCLIALIKGPDGSGQGIQRTFLKPGGLGKARVSKAKLSLGSVSGGAIRIGEPSDQLIICEGLEDGLSLKQEIGLPVWVTAGTSNLAKVVIPDTVTRISIAGDNDDAGRGAVVKAAERYSALGFAVQTFFPDPPFKDFNEQLQKGGRA
jgi:DNA primase